MAFLAVAPVVIQLLSAAAPIAADIFKFCKEMYSEYKESKPPKAAASGENPPSEQLVHIKQEISELKGMMKNSTKSTLQCQEMISKLDKKLDQMTLEATGLKGIVEDLASSTMTGFERLDHAFSQV